MIIVLTIIINIIIQTLIGGIHNIILYDSMSILRIIIIYVRHCKFVAEHCIIMFWRNRALTKTPVRHTS